MYKNLCVLAPDTFTHILSSKLECEILPQRTTGGGDKETFRLSKSWRLTSKKNDKKKMWVKACLRLRSAFFFPKIICEEYYDVSRNC
jgi:hypothetical protein